ncbi:calmodulin-like protein 3 [Musa acuminata AAA Group]|uniref:EF-hand domain-containing protein n=1 Tax=Musa acuminata subsp. malaccensis TaxID=214687 RepID=A0A804KH23_MUSAM|nr:PREDICTED: calmodulin-like protein 3 [Musa acuminata subsp. malaccensis]
MELTPMPAIFVGIFLICHHLNSRLLRFLPEKLISLLLPFSWHPPTSKDGLSPPATALSSIASFRSPSFGPKASARVMDPSELKRVFQMFDRNGDGRITKTELSDSLENLGIYIPEAELASMIEKIDVNGDGCVDMDEFGALYRSIMDERDEEEDMREAFNVFDQNGDGYISVEELRSVLVSLGVKQGRTAEDCRMMINKVDVDGDGRVDFKEFKQMMKGGGFAALS